MRDWKDGKWVGMKGGEPAASPQATRLDRVLVIDDPLSDAVVKALSATQPAAGTTPRPPGTICGVCKQPFDDPQAFIEHSRKCEGTTPQAERPHSYIDCEIKGCPKCAAIEYEEGGEFLPPARAVAPVETPRDCSNCGHPLPCHCDDVGWGGTPAQTRLTAEQFWRDNINQFWNCDDEMTWQFAEAFRDKSEAGLREEIERLQREFCNRVHTELDASERARLANELEPPK